MKQLFRDNLKGKVWLEEVSVPRCKKGGLLIQNIFSAISVGTEGSSLKLSMSDPFTKAKSRPDDVKKLANLVNREGILTSYRIMKEKLEYPNSLGYSSVGVVIEVGEGITEFSVGDIVAAGGGGYATHSEIVWVPKNLCAKVPSDVNLKDAAFTTLGAIAIESIRKSKTTFGESIAVIGLGIIGQLVVQIAKSAGIRVIAIDIDSRKVEIANKVGADVAISRNDDNLFSIISEFTNSFGVDKVIIAASTSKSDPIDLATNIVRDTGRITVVGNVPMNINRKKFYEKNLSINVSRSYGPGRYDQNYELKGLDYPIGNVRWTLNRNMSSFIELLKSKKVNLAPLITQEFNFEDSDKAYPSLLQNDKKLILGSLFHYNLKVNRKLTKINLNHRKSLDSNVLNIGIIGAGNYAKNILLPIIASNENINFTGVAANSSNNSSYVAKKYKFDYYTTDPDKLITDDNTDLIFIVTHHSTHSEYAEKALLSGKSVFLEKPLAINNKQLISISNVMQEANSFLTLGFNRRFSPMINKIKGVLGDTKMPFSINYTINASKVSHNHWVKDLEIGGGRIVGEICHFVDTCSYLFNSYPNKVYSQSISPKDSSTTKEESLNISLSFGDGSIATIQYFSNGSESFPKERIDIFKEDLIISLSDFKEAFKSKKRERCAPPAPAYGLYLLSVKY